VEGAGVDLSDLKGVRAGETAWVFGSGGTLNYLHPEFFADKLVVSTNLGPVEWGVSPDFVFTHYHTIAVEALGLGVPVVTLAGDTLTHQAWQGEKPDNLVLVPQDSYVGPSDSWDVFGRHAPRPDSLAYGSSSLHGAMHLAAWIGAKHLVMVGADCGTLDGKVNVGNYAVLGGTGDTDRILSLYNRDHRRMKEWLVANYGVTVYSLNPFINLNLEGHTFVGPDGRY
jgi:hypothetical protein